jgi:hypothetical protein
LRSGLNNLPLFQYYAVIDHITFDEFLSAICRFCFNLKEMAASMYIVVAGEDPGFDIYVNGHALARNEDSLEKLAGQLKVSPLLEFFSADENSMALLLEQGAGDPDWVRNLPEPQWFSASDGLQTVRALIQYFLKSPAALGSETQPVLTELREYQHVLEKTAQRHLRWHLAVSWR